MSERDGAGNTLAPLPGEPGIPDVAQPKRSPISRKGLFAVVLLVVSLIAASAFSIQRFVTSGKKTEEGEAKRAGDRPVAAIGEPRRLDIPATVAATPTPTASLPRVPALIPTPEETAPIGIRRSTPNAATPSGPKPIAPEDAP